MTHYSTTAAPYKMPRPLPQAELAALLGRHMRSTSRVLGLDLGTHVWRQAVQQAGLTSLLSSPGDLQLLVPSDRAFAGLLHELKLNRDELFADLPRLRKILLGHVVMGAPALELARPAMLIRCAEQSALLMQGEGRMRDAQGREAQILGQMDQRPGLMPRSHLIDRVLLPAQRGLLSLLADSPAHSEFLADLQRSELSTWLNSAGPFTVLAPCNEAWASQKAALRQQPSASIHAMHAIPALLARHLLAGRWLSDELPWGGRLTTLSGEALHLSPLGLLDTGLGPQALHRSSDKLASNGVLHRLTVVPTTPI